MAVAGDGYALPVRSAEGGGDSTALWCGATRQAVPMGDAPNVSVFADEHAHNLTRLQRLTGLAPPPGAPLLGRAGLRLHTADRLPLAGPLPDPAQPLPRPRAALAPRVPGLFVLGALGARGLTLAPLLARLVAAQATGTPWPLEQDLADAVDPVRWRVRDLKHAPARR
jgi:tRNA 5-methylaminomethyl-2-thiouridine biosynthesis bifunctional protein